MAHCRVLVVEDDQDSREAIVDLLNSEGYEAAGAADGTAALAVLHRGDFKPDVILADLYMPSMGGHELHARLQAEATWKHIPVVFVSAMPLNGSTQGFEVLEKPVDIDALLAVVRRGCAANAA
jgi:CheY-like chemotaxis protein